MQSAKVTEAWSRLATTAKRLVILPVLGKSDIKQATGVKRTLSTTPQKRRDRVYRLFLDNILRVTNNGVALICGIALGQVRIANVLCEEERKQLIHLIQTTENSDINHSILCSLANKYQIPSSGQDILPSQDIAARHSQGLKSPLNDVSQHKPIAEQIDLNTTAPNQRVFQNASLEGIAAIFNQHMCDNIRRVFVNGEQKAAVTTAFPIWAGPVDCLMSLEVSESSVQWLARTLFNVEVRLINGVWHIIVNGGFSLVVSSSEATIKGASDEAIACAFGPEIQTAITENPIRKREVESCIYVTECVSMILTEKGAIVNLALSLDEGVKIRKKLYT